MKTQFATLYTSILVLTLSTPAVVRAQQCGQTITAPVTLQADLSCPTSHGLILKNGASLDCQGHTITGGDRADKYGIYVNTASNVLVQNCVVEHFEIGVRLRAATNCTVQNSTLQHNTRYGLVLTAGSTGALIQGNTVYNNSDEGLHISGPTGSDAGHRILNNIVNNNAIEGVYLLNSNANTIANNQIQNHGTAGIYAKSSDRNRFEGNTLTNDSFHLAPGSQLNVLTSNTVIGNRLKLDGASSNQIDHMTVQGDGGKPSNAYDFNNAPDNTVSDSQALNPADYHIRAANQSTNNVFTRFTATPALRCFVDGRSNVTVTDPAGNPLPCE